MNEQIFGYTFKNTWIHKLSAVSKLILFLGVSIISMISYDTRFLVFVMIISLLLLQQSKVKWSQIKTIVLLVASFSLLNLITVYLFSPAHGVEIYQSRHVIFNAGYFTLTWEQLFYEFNLMLKYIVTLPLALVFLLTTNPSELAASLNKIKVPYKISYAVSLSLRYIPDIQQDFIQIKSAQQARGYELSKKESLINRIKGSIQILLPLIFSSLDKIQTISQAMELRRFGRHKHRTWYMAQKLKKQDIIIILLTLTVIIIGILLFILNQSRFFNPFK